MDVRTVIQKILDDTLLPYGVLSNHLRRVDADYIENSDVAVNKDEYVVFRVVSNRPHTTKRPTRAIRTRKHACKRSKTQF